MRIVEPVLVRALSQGGSIGGRRSVWLCLPNAVRSRSMRRRPEMKFTRDEIEQAFQTFQDRAKAAGKSHDWEEWSHCFTEDADYYEHHYGRMKGRAEILKWIQSTMNEPLFAEMTEFPIDWYMIDEERGWIMCQVANVMDDPGDGSDHR